MSTDIGKAVTAAREWLSEHPEDAREDDTGVLGTLDTGLRVQVDDGHGSTVVTDMPTAIGGGGNAFTPGTLMRAAVASCNASTIAMIAAERGLEVTRLEVRVDSVSDNRGMLGGSGVPAAPLELRIRYRIEGPGLDNAQVSDLVTTAEGRSPLLGTLRLPIPVVTTIEPAAGRGDPG